jgi:hypothetical protein
MDSSFERALIEVWRQALVENAKVVELGSERYPVPGELLRGPILPANRAAKGRCLSLLERTW